MRLAAGSTGESHRLHQGGLPHGEPLFSHQNAIKKKQLTDFQN
jgi:hypothetical protein